MRKLNFAGLIILLLFAGTCPVSAQNNPVPDPVLADSTFNLYKSGNIFISGQPTEENLETLAGKGVKLVINVRTPGEMKKFAEEHFDEGSFIKLHDMDYLNLGVGGSEGFKPEVIKEIAAKIADTNGKVLIHCGSGVRATWVWMAWLVNTGQCSIDEAVRLGKEATFSFPFAELLGYPVSIKPAQN